MIKMISTMVTCLVVLSANAFADPIINPSGGYLNSGELMFVNGGNDSNADWLALEGQMEDWFFTEKSLVRDIDLTFYDKVEEPSTGFGDLTVSYSSDKRSGTWTTALPIEFYTVKAGPAYAMYWINGTDTTGSWSTSDLTVGQNLNIPELSHLSSWNPEETNVPVPEPATMLLIGTGLAGFLGVARRKRK